MLCGHASQSRLHVPDRHASRTSVTGSRVLVGRARGAAPQPAGEPQYLTLEDGIPGYVVAVQSVGAESRYHLDIETDDIEAEVARLAALGATEVSSWLECRTLRAPGGHLLCVIPVHSDPEYFAQHARTWP